MKLKRQFLLSLILILIFLQFCHMKRLRKRNKTKRSKNTIVDRIKESVAPVGEFFSKLKHRWFNPSNQEEKPSSGNTDKELESKAIFNDSYLELQQYLQSNFTAQTSTILDKKKKNNLKPEDFRRKRLTKLFSNDDQQQINSLYELTKTVENNLKRKIKLTIKENKTLIIYLVGVSEILGKLSFHKEYYFMIFESSDVTVRKLIERQEAVLMKLNDQLKDVLYSADDSNNYIPKVLYFDEMLRKDKNNLFCNKNWPQIVIKGKNEEGYYGPYGFLQIKSESFMDTEIDYYPSYVDYLHILMLIDVLIALHEKDVFHLNLNRENVRLVEIVDCLPEIVNFNLNKQIRLEGFEFAETKGSVKDEEIDQIRPYSVYVPKDIFRNRSKVEVDLWSVSMLILERLGQEPKEVYRAYEEKKNTSFDTDKNLDKKQYVVNFINSTVFVEPPIIKRVEELKKGIESKLQAY